MATDITFLTEIYEHCTTNMCPPQQQMKTRQQIFSPLFVFGADPGWRKNRIRDKHPGCATLGSVCFHPSQDSEVIRYNTYISMTFILLRVTDQRGKLWYRYRVLSDFPGRINTTEKYGIRFGV
jgi:hypothetical protein